MKAKQIKIYSFGRSNIKDGIITFENLEDNQITLSESFLMNALECYKNIKLEDGELVERNNKSVAPQYRRKSKR